MSIFSYNELSCFKQQPGDNTKYLIQRNLSQLIQIVLCFFQHLQCINDATQFVNSAQCKGKALDQLKYVLLIGENKITKHVETIIKALIRITQLDTIQNSNIKMKQIVEIIGYHVKSDYYIPLMLNILNQEEMKNSIKNTIILLNLISHMLLRSQGLEGQVHSLIKIIAHYQNIFYDNDQGLLAIFQITATLIRRLDQKMVNSEFTQVIFSVLINVQATKTIPEQKRKEGTICMQELAKKSGFASIADLHANEVGPIFQKIIKNKEYTNWTKTSKDRFKFDTIVRNCHSEVSRFLPQILQIFQFLINPQSDLETRMDTLVLIQYVLEISELKESIHPFSPQLMKKILIPAIQWKVGKPQIKIRKAGIINMISLIDKEFINEQQCLDSFKELFPHLKNCLNDDWAPELRLASCELVEKYLLATKQNISDDELRELYPILLERLDDSQDPIRNKITIAINIFFSCRYIKLSSSTLEYMINTIFIHFDDNSQEIQDSIYTTLKYAALVDSKQVLKNAEVALKKMKHKEKCQELIDFCKDRIEDEKI